MCYATFLQLKTKLKCRAIIELLTYTVRKVSSKKKIVNSKFR